MAQSKSPHDDNKPII